MRDATDKPLVAYPNSGESYDAASKNWRRDAGAAATPFGDWASLWHDAGARLIGGCCRTGPDDIREVARCVRH
jgi:homocysteine S-methyltransferase